MRNVKLSIARKERVYFDGRFLTNGHWMVDTESGSGTMAHLSLKDLDALLQAGIRFAYHGDLSGGERLRTGEEASLPDCERVWGEWDEDKTSQAHKLTSTPFFWRTRLRGGARPTLCRVYRRESGELVALAEEVEAVVEALTADLGMLHQSDPSSPISVCDSSGARVAVVMPIRAEGLAEALGKLAQLQTPQAVAV